MKNLQKHLFLILLLIQFLQTFAQNKSYQKLAILGKWKASVGTEYFGSMLLINNIGKIFISDTTECINNVNFEMCFQDDTLILSKQEKGLRFAIPYSFNLNDSLDYAIINKLNYSKYKDYCSLNFLFNNKEYRFNVSFVPFAKDNERYAILNDNKGQLILLKRDIIKK